MSRALAVVSLAVALAAGSVPSAVRAQQAPAAPPVTIAQPSHRQVVDWLEYTGQFAPVEFVEVRARVGGYLTSINFTDGQVVNKGDLLFVIDPRPFEIALASAKARLEQARAQLDLANRQLGRAGDLVKRDVVSQSVMDQRVQDTRVAETNVEVAKASVRDAEVNLDYTRVTAPVTGRISSHRVSIGNLINSGAGGGAATLLTTIVSLDPIHLNFDISEQDYLALQRANARDGKLPVQVRLGDEKDWGREGRIDFIDNQIERSAGTIRLRAVLNNPNLFITPGQFAKLRLPSSAPYEALLVPDAAVVTDQSNKVVMTVADDGTVVPKLVQVGPVQDGNMRVIRSGITDTDRVIVNGLMRARPGAKVTPQTASSEPAPAAK